VANILVRGLDDDVKQALRVIAAHNGRSMEAEARAMLTTAVTAAASPPADDQGSWFDRMHSAARLLLTDDDAALVDEWAAGLDQRELPGPAVRFD
jgi:hypothetical protein